MCLYVRMAAQTCVHVHACRDEFAHAFMHVFAPLHMQQCVHRTHAHLRAPRASVGVFAYVHDCIHVCTYIDAYIYACRGGFTCAFMHMFMHTCVKYMCTHLCMCVHT